MDGDAKVQVRTRTVEHTDLVRKLSQNLPRDGNIYDHVRQIDPLSPPPADLFIETVTCAPGVLNSRKLTLNKSSVT